MGIVCALAGAAFGIAGVAAAPKHPKAKTRAATNAARDHEGGRERFGGPPVHGDAVVLNQARNGYVTVTQDSGAFKSLSGDQLTIAEGVNNVPYKDVTLTIPANATVRRNDATAHLTDLRPGDRVHVGQSPQGTFVFAEDAAHQRRGPGGPDGRHHGPRGPHGPRGFDGPPPGPPGPPDGPPPGGPGPGGPPSGG